MRILNYSGQDCLIFFKDKYENTIFKQVLKNGENELKICKFGEFYENLEKKRFYIYAGEGNLEYTDSLKAYDFYNLNVFLLDEVLNKINIKIPKNDKKLINDFLEVYEINANKGYLYINPPFFEKKEQELLRSENGKA
ncbi:MULTISPECIES: hypothetical protein [unclassified Campylobacter]|uniref:hypothetical protein n=1 Tax=unclassified Campylobacter TaxID=2593542 RepID=UPI001237ABBF|nr:MULTISPECIES: hypothetical protein [unclassified Campylobacter]KAA6225935.1 hypothetical protein FMM57_06940 [Campylobacter sp. LR286c]KAA6231199.1 hypothetical protein FMM58_03745 [Campylobacter sp. LR291e]